jgi:hypothetical protein
LHNLYSLLPSGRSIKKVALATVMAMLFSWSAANAQSYRDDETKYGISIGSDYDTPVGNLAYTFKPAINYNLNFLQQKGDFTANVSFGYHAYTPKMDTFYYAATSTDYGTAEYKNFTVTSFYLGGTYNYPVSDQFKINAGVNLGAYFTHYYLHQSNFALDETDDLSEKDIYIAARLGFTYMLNENVGIGVEGKYNFFAPTGSAEDNDRVGTLYFSWSAGVRLTYIF